ncbi:MAG: arginine--tRNA ligase [Blastocatellia bacterium]|nr:arginine--tRNA ligase [Blastocatellia bacterium]
MLLSIQEKIRTRIRESIAKNFDLTLQNLVLEHPPKVSLGDFAAPVAFELAKQLKAATGAKQNPRQLAEKIREDVLDLPEVERVEVAGAGYLNFFLKRSDVFLRSLQPQTEPATPRIGGKLIVEHTSVNPNKAAHIGHLRNAVLGDTLVRLLRACGETVEVQNYIDNTGVQVADVVVGFQHIEKKTLDDIKAIPGKFDDYCWDLYSKVGRFYEEDKARLELRAAALHSIEAGTGETAEIAEHVAMRILQCHLDTMWRLGISYDVMPRESEVLHLHFWDAAFERLKATGSIVLETEGRNKGCWVLPAEGDEAAAGEETEHDADKILVRSNGTVNYTGKDIAYHLWKLGQLGMDFHYRPFFTYPDGHQVWISTTETPQAEISHEAFGNGAAYFNVIDVGQSYTQDFVKKGILAVSEESARVRVARSSHVNYEKVALTPASCIELGFELSEEDRKRTVINMAGRKGLGVKVDDLINRLEAAALKRVAEHEVDRAQKKPGTELTEQEQVIASKAIAVGALRYFLLKFTRNTVIAFDFKEALAAEGESGVFLLYAIRRTYAIFEEANARGLQTDNLAQELADNLAQIPDYFSGAEGDDLWSLVNLALRLEEVLQEAAEILEPARLAKYAFQLAQQFSAFYNTKNNRILQQTDPMRQKVLFGIVKLTQRSLESAGKVLGIEVPARM